MRSRIDAIGALQQDGGECLRYCGSVPTGFISIAGNRMKPPHIHVSRDDFEVKFWLEPISFAFNYGFPSTEVNDIRRLVEENCDFLLQAYHRFHGNG